jgi:hypothetical protein
MARGIVGPFETRKPEIDYPCMIGDIETAAGLTVKEPDDGVVHFARWRPFDQNALSRSPILAPARDRPDPGMEAAALLSGFGVIVDDALLRHASLLRRIKVMATRSKTSGFEPIASCPQPERYVSNKPESGLSSDTAKAT